MIITTELNKSFDGLEVAPLTLEQLRDANVAAFNSCNKGESVAEIAIKTVEMIPKEIRDSREGIDLLTKEDETAYLSEPGVRLDRTVKAVKLGTGLIRRIDLYIAVESRCCIIIVNQYGFVTKELHLNLKQWGLFMDVSSANHYISKDGFKLIKGVRLTDSKILLEVKKLRRNGYYRVTTVTKGIVEVQDEVNFLVIGNVGNIIHHFKAFDGHVVFTLKTDKSRRFNLKHRHKRMSSSIGLSYFENHVNVTNQALTMNKLLDTLPCELNGDQAYDIINILGFHLLASRIRLSLPSFYQKPYFRKLALRLGIIEYNDDKKELVALNTKFTQGDN